MVATRHKARKVREAEYKYLLGVLKLTYKVYAIEDEDQNVFYYQHLIEFKFGRTIRSWQFRDSTPRYELPVDNES